MQKVLFYYNTIANLFVKSRPKEDDLLGKAPVMAYPAKLIPHLAAKRSYSVSLSCLSALEICAKVLPLLGFTETFNIEILIPKIEILHNTNFVFLLNKDIRFCRFSFSSRS